MKQTNPVDFGNRVRERREARGLSQARLGKLSGYSQTNIGWIEQGRMKRPHIAAEALSEALQCPVEYLLRGIGPKETGPLIMSPEQVRDIYSEFSPEDAAAITAAIMELAEAAKKKRKIG